MTTFLSRTKTVASCALAALVAMTATTATTFARMIIPGTTLLDGTIHLSGGGLSSPTAEPDDPFSKPRTPGQPTLIARMIDSVKFRWTDNSSYEIGYNLYRGPSLNGPWTRIAVFGITPGNSRDMEYVDSGLPRDSGAYYRVEAYNFQGQSFSRPQFFSTIDGRKVSRLRLRIRTANVSDAETDDSVNVALRDHDDGGTWLNYGRDDFERGDEFTYELRLDDIFDGIQDLSEINHIYLLKPGDDGWCIESLTLIADTRKTVTNGEVEGVELFHQDFGSTSSTCRWLDGQQNYLVIGRDTLRAHPSWQAYQQPEPSIALLKTDLEKRIEGTVGHIIHAGTYVDKFPLPAFHLDINWAGDALDGESYVKVSRKDDQAVHVEFNLEGDIPGPSSLTGGLSFDLRFTGSCRTETTVCERLTFRQGNIQLPEECRTETTPAEIEMTAENIHATADFDWITEAMTFWLINLAEDDIADKIVDSLPDFSQTISVDDQRVSCITPSVTASGSVNFLPTSAPETTTGGSKPLEGLNTSGILPTAGNMLGVGGTRTTGTTRLPTTRILAR